MNHHASNVITVASTTTTLNDDPLALDVAFEESEQATPPLTEIPRLWWFNGLPVCDSDVAAVGWHIRAGIDHYLDETMKGLQIPCYAVQHQKPDRHGNTDPKSYWHLRSCSLIFIAQRAQSALEMGRSLDERQGIAYAWGTVRDEQGNPVPHKRGKQQGKEKRGTVLKARVFIHELYQHGYYDWLPLSLSGFATDSLLKAFEAHYRVLHTYSAWRRSQGKNPTAPFYLFSLPLGPGAIKLVGEPPEQGKIYEIVAQIPDSVDTAYLEKHVIPLELIQRLREGLVAETIAWSIDETRKIVAGPTGQGEPLALPEQTSERATPAPQIQPASLPPAAPQESDPQVGQAELTWIRKTYCAGNPQLAEQVCQYFQVAGLEHLRMSHFKVLVAQVRKNTPSQPR